MNEDKIKKGWAGNISEVLHELRDHLSVDCSEDNYVFKAIKLIIAQQCYLNDLERFIDIVMEELGVKTRIIEDGSFSKIIREFRFQDIKEKLDSELDELLTNKVK